MGYSPHPMQHRSRQHEMGGGKFESERQRRAMWANAPAAARAWAENLPTTRAMWVGMSRTRLHPTLGGTAKAVGRGLTKSGKAAAPHLRAKRAR